MHRSPINLVDPIIDGDAPGALEDVFAADFAPRDGGPSRMTLCLMLAVSSVVNLIVRSLIGERATGSIVCASGANLVDAQIVTINDGYHAAKVFEFDSNAAFTGGRVQVAFTALDTAEEVRDALLAAIQGAGLFITATADPENVAKILLEHQKPGTIGNVAITDTVAHASFVVVGMTGGEGNTIILPLNGGDALDADTFYTLEAWIDKALQYNLHLETDGAIPYLVLVEEK